MILLYLANPNLNSYPVSIELKRLGVNDDQIRLCDLTVKSSLSGVLDGCSKLVVCTTSQPKWKVSYKVKSVLRWFIGRVRPPRIEELYYTLNRRPFEVDFLGQKNLIDESVQAQVEHVVLLSSMGGKQYLALVTNLYL